MKESVVTKKQMVPLKLDVQGMQWLVIGGGQKAYEVVNRLLKVSNDISLTVISENFETHFETLVQKHQSVKLIERKYEVQDLAGSNMMVIATENKILDEKIYAEAKQQNALVYLPSHPQLSDFYFLKEHEQGEHTTTVHVKKNSEQYWRGLASKLIFAFFFMIVGYIVISYLPLPGFSATWVLIKPYFNYQLLFFACAGFIAQMVDGTLGMGYGVTSATCLMTLGINPVSVSAAIHTSEIFTTATSGYSHYKFKNVNKKLFKHLVIPGCIGAALGALMLVFLGEKYGKLLLPIIAAYAFFLGLKILIKAFSQQTQNKKIKRLGWLASAGGFLDSFGGGGWGPIVTSTLIAKGRSPRYTIGSVNLAEFFITMTSAFTFFLTVGISHLNVVVGLLTGGAIASPIAARLAGRLPRKTMMILVGIMVMIWCTRMIIKSIF
jgi:uncharacterized membrane protein YfcA